MRKNIIELSVEQREELEALIRAGRADACSIQHAQLLLKLDSGLGEISSRHV